MPQEAKCIAWKAWSSLELSRPCNTMTRGALRAAAHRYKSAVRRETGSQGDFQVFALADGKGPAQPELRYVGLAGQ